METARTALGLLLSGILVLLLACSQSSDRSTNPTPGSRTLSIAMPLGAAISQGFHVTRVNVTIEREGFTQSLDLTIANETASGVFTNLEPAMYSIAVEVYDGETLIAEGSGEGDVVAGETASVNIDLEFHVGNLEVIVNWPGSGTEPPIVLTIPATNSTGVTSPPLESGVLYYITAEGTYFGCYNQCGEDAEWQCGRYASDPPDHCDDPANWVEEGGSDPEQQRAHDILIDNEEYDWMGTVDGVEFQAHQFSPIHKYRVQYLGQGIPIHLHIWDGQYVDNSGSLTVTIAPSGP